MRMRLRTVLQPVSQSGRSVDRGGLHALEHAMMSMAPLCCDIDGSELSCQHTRRDSDPNRYLLLLFETQKGGAGMATKLYEHFETLLARAVEHPPLSTRSKQHRPNRSLAFVVDFFRFVQIYHDP